MDGSLIFSTSPPLLDAAMAGHGIALLREDDVMSHVEADELVRVMAA